MFHDLTKYSPVPYHTLDLLRHSSLRIILLLRPARHINIHSRTLTRENLRAERLPAQIQLRGVDLIEHDGWQGTEDLHLEFGAFDDVDAADEGVDDERDGSAVVEGDGVCFADDADGGFGAARDEDGVRD